MTTYKPGFRDGIGVLLIAGLIPLDYWWWGELYDYFSLTWWIVIGLNVASPFLGVFLIRWGEKRVDLDVALKRRAEVNSAIVSTREGVHDA